MNYAIKLLVFILFIYNNSISLLNAQNIEKRLSPEDVAKSMEENLTWNLENELSNYYSKTSFVIKANISLYRSIPQRRTQALQNLPNTLLSRGIEKLPGLPVVPDQPKTEEPNIDQKSISELIQQFFSEDGYRISRIMINVLVDSSYKKDDISFVQRMVLIKAGLKPSRGDRVNVEVLNFPSKLKHSIKEKPEKKAATPFLTWEKAQPYLFFLITITLISILLFVLINRILKSKNRKGVINRRTTQITKSSPVSQEVEKNQSPVLEYIIGAPEASANIFQEWIDFMGDQGIENVAILLKSVSPRLLDLISPYMNNDTVDKVRFSIERSGKAQPTLLAQLNHKFDQEFRILSLRNHNQEKENELFSFLHQLTDEQVYQLIRNIELGIAAVVIAQLPPERGGNIMKKFNEQQQKKIFLMISKIEKIPLGSYKELAQKLADKAESLISMKYIASDSVETIVNLLDQYDESSQSEILNHIKCNDLHFANRVRERFISFSDITNMPNSDLRDVLRSVDREILATSLVDLDENDIERIISALPDKMAEMVRSSLDMKRETNDIDVDKARQNLMKNVRKRIKLKNVEQQQTKI